MDIVSTPPKSIRPSAMSIWGKEFAERFMRPCMSEDFPSLLSVHTKFSMRAELAEMALRTPDYDQQVIYYLLMYISLVKKYFPENFKIMIQNIMKFFDASYESAVRVKAMRVLVKLLVVLRSQKVEVQEPELIKKTYEIFTSLNCEDCVRGSCIKLLAKYAMVSMEARREVALIGFGTTLLRLALRPEGITQAMFRLCIFAIHYFSLYPELFVVQEKDKWRTADFIVENWPEIPADASPLQRTKFKRCLFHVFSSLDFLLNNNKVLQEHVLARINVASLLVWMDWSILDFEMRNHLFALGSRILTKVLRLVSYAAKTKEIDRFLKHKLAERLLALYGTTRYGEAGDYMSSILGDLMRGGEERLQALIDAGAIQVIREVVMQKAQRFFDSDLIEAMRDAILRGSEKQAEEILDKGAADIFATLVKQKLKKTSTVADTVLGLEGMRCAIEKCEDAARRFVDCRDKLEELKKHMNKRISILAGCILCQIEQVLPMDK